MKCVEIIVKTHPNYGSEDYYRLRPNEYSYVRDFRSFLIKTRFHSRSRSYVNIKMTDLNLLQGHKRSWMQLSPKKLHM